MAHRTWWAALAVVPLLVSCAGADGTLTSAADDALGSSICSPGNDAGEARFGWDGMRNHGTEPITLTEIRLDERSTNAHLVRAGFFQQATTGTTGGVDAYDGTFDGQPSLVLPPGEVALIDVVIRNDHPDDIAVAYGLWISGTEPDGTAVTGHTCWVLAVAPAGIDCSKPEGGEAYDIDTDYMTSTCSKP